MYLQIKKTKQITKPRGKETTVTHIGLYKDDGTYVKFVPHDDIVLEKLLEAKIDITIPELEGLVKEHEVDKILPKDNLFDNVLLTL